MKKLRQKLRALLSIMTTAVVLAGCGTTAPANVEVLRRVVGTDLIGVQGKTEKDQDDINRTVIRLGAAGVYTKPELEAHGRAVQGQ